MKCQRCDGPGAALIFTVDFFDGESIEIWACDKCVVICVAGWMGVENGQTAEVIEDMVHDVEQTFYVEQGASG